MKRPNWLDWVVYRLFRWWWNPILRDNPSMTLAMVEFMRDFVEAAEEAYVEIEVTEVGQ